MQPVSHYFENHIGRCARIFVFILSAGGATCSGLASFSCQFYHFEAVNNTPWSGLEPPYDSAIGADIGLFTYQITDSTDSADLGEGCIAFDGRFSDFSEGNGLWEAAQWCALFAFATSGLAFFINLLELIGCSFYCSFIFACTLLWIAGALQACTVMVLGGNDYCFNSNSNLECSIGTAGYLSAAASASFFVAAILLCGCPRPDPCAGDVCCKAKKTADATPKDSEYDDGTDEESPEAVPIVTRKQEQDPQDVKREAPLEATKKKLEPPGGKAISRRATAEAENADGEPKAKPEPVPVMVLKSQSSPYDRDVKEEPEGPPDLDKHEPAHQEERGIELELEHAMTENVQEPESQEEIEAVYECEAIVVKAPSSPSDGDMKEESEGPPDSDKQEPAHQEEMGIELEPEREPVMTENVQEPESQEEIEAEAELIMTENAQAPKPQEEIEEAEPGGRKANKAPESEEKPDKEEQEMAEEEIKKDVDSQDAQHDDEEEIVQAERLENDNECEEISIDNGHEEEEEEIISSSDDEAMLVFDDQDSSTTDGSDTLDDGHDADISDISWW